MMVGNSTPAASKRTEDDNRLAPSETTNALRVWQRVLGAWAAADIDEVVKQFADEFTFIDHALGLEFKEKDRLREFLARIREFIPESERRDQTILGSEDRIVSQWTFTAVQNEPFLNGRFRKVKISAQGVSVLRIVNGRIVEWSEYYDQVNSRRYPLVGWFTDWCEL
jgi:steroid delta-isomerase-like uncharacterized protein